MSYCSPFASLTACLGIALCTCSADAAPVDVPPLYDYQPARVYTYELEIKLPDKDEYKDKWKEISSQQWFVRYQPLKLKFSLICINFRQPETQKISQLVDLLGGEGYPGITKNFMIGFDPEQTLDTVKLGSERRPARLFAASAKTNSGAIGLPSFSRKGEYDWYLPMQTNELSIIQYAAIMEQPPPSMGHHACMKPKTEISRWEVEDLLKKLNTMAEEQGAWDISWKETGDISWNIHRGEEAQASRVPIMLGRKFFFALPTQTEWEYAARGGDLNQQHYGEDYPLAVFSDQDAAAEYEHCTGNTKNSSVSSEERKKNCLGLRNMIGNAQEWVDDDRIPRGSEFSGDPTKRIPSAKSASPAGFGKDIGSSQGADNIGFRLVIRSHIFDENHQPYGLSPGVQPAPPRSSDKHLASAEEYLFNTYGLNCGNEDIRRSKNDTECERALEAFRQAANSGTANAQYCLGYCYERGIGTSINHEEALKNYTRAALQNHAKAQYRMGRYYDKTTKVPNSKKNSGTAFEQYTKAANQNYAPAQYALGYCYESGIGVACNLNEAYKHYLNAAIQGETLAQERLTNFLTYYAGLKDSQNLNIIIDVVKDKVASFSTNEDKIICAEAYCYLGRCYIQAAALQTSERRKLEEQAFEAYQRAVKYHNHAWALARLGYCYQEGIGVKRDMTQAIIHYEQAASFGNEYAKQWLKSIKQN